MPAQRWSFPDGWRDAQAQRGTVSTDGTGDVTAWHRSPFSTNGGNCVEIGITGPDAATYKDDPDKLLVLRDSKDPDGPRLYFTPSEWQAFALGVKRGAFDSLR